MGVGSWQLAVGSWQLAVGSWKLTRSQLSRRAEDLHPVRSSISAIRDCRSKFLESGVEDVGPMPRGIHPGTDGGGRARLPVGDVLCVGQPPVSDGGQSIVRFRIAGSAKHVSHLAERSHLVGVKLRGSHQEWAHLECRQTGSVTFLIGHRGHFSGGAGVRTSGFSPGRARWRRAAAGQDQEPGQRKANRTGGHVDRRCKGGAVGEPRSSELFAGSEAKRLFLLEHTFVNSLRLRHHSEGPLLIFLWILA